MIFVTKIQYFWVLLNKLIFFWKQFEILKKSVYLHSLFGKKIVNDEKNVPTFSKKTQKQAWFPKPYGHKEWPSCIGRTPKKGKEKIDRVGRTAAQAIAAKKNSWNPGRKPGFFFELYLR